MDFGNRCIAFDNVQAEFALDFAVYILRNNLTVRPEDFSEEQKVIEKIKRHENVVAFKDIQILQNDMKKLQNITK